ncbi:MAG: AMP-binding protein, partial [Burkholderiales bacterium]|nr:AMP-binding protein [Burkholderiales bacterium]
MDTPIATNALVLGSLPARHARYRPERLAVVAPGAAGEVRLSWRAFDAYVNRLANALAALGVTRGERVATVLANSLPLLAAYWACAKLGAVAVPLSPLLNASGLASLLADAAPRVVLAGRERAAALADARAGLRSRVQWVLADGTPPDATWHGLDALLAAAPEGPPQAHVEAGDLLTLMYTSGTTGLPK